MSREYFSAPGLSDCFLKDCFALGRNERPKLPKLIECIVGIRQALEESKSSPEIEFLAMRDLEPSSKVGFERALEEMRRQGVPNYYDDQRFGSVGDEKRSLRSQRTDSAPVEVAAWTTASG